MEIHKVLNNNFVIVLNENHEEQIVGGKGIAFGKRAGQQIDSELVNKTFVVPTAEDGREVQKYVEALPIECLEIAINIIEIAKIKTGKVISESSSLAIADHINSSIERYKQGLNVPNYMLWELKKFYTVEYEVGLYGLDLIKDQFAIELPDDEAGFIATHVIDGELENTNIEQVYKTATLIKDISNIVKYYFNVSFDDDSIYYYRFITHLKFFASRLFNDLMMNQNDDNLLYEMIQKSYTNSFNCTLKIAEYLQKKYAYSLSKEEKVYLTIHIENVIYKSNK